MQNEMTEIEASEIFHKKEIYSSSIAVRMTHNGVEIDPIFHHILTQVLWTETLFFFLSCFSHFAGL